MEWIFDLCLQSPAMTYSLKQTRALLSEHLTARFAEIELTILNRIRAIASPGESQDPVYRDGLRAAVPVAIRYGLEAIELRDTPPIPVELLVQARLDARYGVDLSDVLRRYVAGRSLFDDFVLEESERDPRIARGESKDLLRIQAMVFEQLVETVATEYGHEVRTRPRPDSVRVADRVKRLLAGELLDTSRLEYDFGIFHIGLMAEGDDVAGSIRDLAKAVGARLLLAEVQGDVVWAWIGTRSPVDREGVGEWVTRNWPKRLRLALGEVGNGLVGWRLTHHQAEAAFAQSLRGPVKVTRYADVALDASVAQDPLLIASLRAIYLAPLERERDRGATLRATLCAYFAANRNCASAAAALGVSRQTVANRLKTVEEVLSHSIVDRAVDLELALRVATTVA